MKEIIAFYTSYWIVIVISDTVAVIVSAVLADRKERSIGGWIFGGLVLGWTAVIILACLSDQRTPSYPSRIVEKHYYPAPQTSEKHMSAPTHRWRCYNCQNMIHTDPCPFCGQVFSVKSDEDDK